jgi:hypothetical protein
MVIGGVICVVGALISQFMAPETTGLTLTKTSQAPLKELIVDHKR